MAIIDITAAGTTGTHSIQKTNVNTEGNFIYYSGLSGVTAQQYPVWAADGNFWIYRSAVGAINGLTSGNLYYIKKLDANSVQFSDTLNGTAKTLTAPTAGSTTLNYPYVYNNQLNISSLYSNQQAVKYYTNGTPIGGLTSGTTYYVRGASAPLGSGALYSFTSPFTFGTAGNTGQTGPVLGTLTAAYNSAGATWATNTAYFNQGAYQGYQDWTVPITGVYEFTVAGAPGKSSGAGGAGGYAPIVKGRVSLTKGEIITIAVGQKGSLNAANLAWPGASGGTFVVRKSNNTPLFVAGGGQSASYTSSGTTTPLVQTTGGPSSTGGAAPGTGGQGGSGLNPGAGGAGGGFLSNGGDSNHGLGGKGFNAGLVGGNGSAAGSSSAGGFGGGGGCDAETYGGPGGSGGYSGGGSGAPTGGGSSFGGYGGSYIISSATNVATSTGQYNGSGLFNNKTITNLAAYNSSQANEGSVAVSLISSSANGTTLHPTATDANAGTNGVTLTPAGTEYHALVPISLDLTSSTINTTDAHGLSSGDAVTYTNSGTLPSGLAQNTVYYINKVDNYTYKLSSTPAPTFTNIIITTPSYSTAERFNKVIVNIATDTITINSHGFLANQPVKYQVNGGTAITPLQDNATYYVKTVVDANRIQLSQSLGGPVIDLTSAGTGTNHSFIYVVVNLTEDSLYIPGHNLVTGSKVVYSNSGGTSIGGLTSGATYYIYRVDNNIVKLATDKNAQTIVDLTSLGVGNHTLTANAIDLTADTISIPSHGFSSGELVQYDAVGQTAIGGLTSGNPYYIILIDGNNIKLATTLVNANAGTAIDLTSYGVGTHRILSLTKSPDGIYQIASIPNQYSFTVTANGYVPLIVKTFTPRQVIDTQQNNIKILNHGFVTGTKLTYANSGGTSIGGLTTATDYYAIAINKDYLRLATSADNASSGIPIAFTSFGGGVDHILTSAQINGFVTGSGTVSTTSGSTIVTGTSTQFSKILKVGDKFRLFPPNTTVVSTFAASAITVNTTNTITITGHSFSTGDTVVFYNGGGVTPTGLTNNYFYYIRRIDANIVKLFNTSTDAVNNTNPVIITTQGTGTAFTLTKTVPVSPIIRKITAIGSDTQITVDRPYSGTFNSVSYSYQTFLYVRPQGYSLHRSFDGGVEMSTGLGISYSQIIRQTRKYFRYQPGKGLQTSFGINFKPTIDLMSLVRVSSTTFQGTTRRPHGLINGLYITISEAKTNTGANSTVYNGTFQVTVLDSTNFTCIATSTVPTSPNDKAYGFPQFNVKSWSNGAIRAGMFDFQNGMFFEFDGQKIYAVRRSSTQQVAGTASALQGSEFVFGSGTSFTTQLAAGDMIVMRGQSYKVSSVLSDTRITVKPEYKGASGTTKEFNPGDGVTGVVNVAQDWFFIQSHGFTDNLPVVYDSIDGTPIGGLINGRTYYVRLIDNNYFYLKASPDSSTNVLISDAGSGTPHSFTPAKSGIIMTKTVDTRVPQEQWSVDPCDGTGPTGYNLDLNRIQMAYLDFSWYGAGKIRFGFKGPTGEVTYVHEFIHNNIMLESYFRSGNLPTRYEVATFDTPTYIPFLFHWGTAVVMDGRFDDDKAYLFTQSSQTLTVTGTTAKSFGSSAINAATNQINIPTHGFTTGDAVQFLSYTATGTVGTNTQNPGTVSQTNAPYTNLTNTIIYYVRAVDVNNVTLHPTNADAIATGGTNVIDITTQGNAQYTYYLYPTGSLNNTSGANYKPLISIRLSPSVSSGLTGKLGDRDIINRMQLRLKELAISTTQLVDVKVLINPRLNNLNFSAQASPSLTQYIQHTSNDTISGGTQIYNFRAAGQNGVEASTTVDISQLFELSNSILGGDSVFPDGPDIITIAVSRLTGSTTLASAKLTWTEAQA
jgi:hypothetical protein